MLKKMVELALSWRGACKESMDCETCDERQECDLVLKVLLALDGLS